MFSDRQRPQVSAEVQAKRAGYPRVSTPHGKTWREEIITSWVCVCCQVQTLHNINKYSDNLQSLHIGNSVQVLPNYLQPEGTFSDSDSEVGLDGNIYEKQGYVIKCPKLRKLCIRDLFVNRGPLYFDLLLKPLQGSR